MANRLLHRLSADRSIVTSAYLSFLASARYSARCSRAHVSTSLVLLLLLALLLPSAFPTARSDDGRTPKSAVDHVSAGGALPACHGLANCRSSSSSSSSSSRAWAPGRRQLQGYRQNGRQLQGYRQNRRQLQGYRQRRSSHRLRQSSTREVSECWSRQERRDYWQAGAHVVDSPAFVLEKRQYERMHKRCTAGIVDWKAFYYNQSEGVSPAANVDGCKYVFLIPGQWHGLGNRIMSLVSTFTFALVTNRAILMPDDGMLPSMMCNPFPHSSWTIPGPQFWSIKGDMEQAPRNRAEEEGKHSRGVFCHLDWITPQENWFFFCEKVQQDIGEKRFTMFWSDFFFVPPLYFVPAFEARLEALFPDRRVFTHVARSILLPANGLWDRIVRTHKGYLARHDVRIGLQIRPVDETSEDILGRVFDCLTKEMGFLPDVIAPDQWEAMANDAADPDLRGARGDSLVVFVAALNETYARRMAALYREGKPLSAASVTFHSESHDLTEKMDDREQYESALVEMFLLSFSDQLLISDFSTFGYTAAGLGALDPVSLNIVRRSETDWRTNGRPICQKTSSEPCGLSAREKFSCGDEEERKTTVLLPYVTTCPVIGSGLHLVLPPLADVT